MTATIGFAGRARTSELYTALRYRWSAQQFVAEPLAKKWMEPAIPFAAMLATIAICGFFLPNYFSWSNAMLTAREFAEFGIVAIAMTVVVISGGIDLSVGAVFALTNLFALLLINGFGQPMAIAVPLVLLLGACLGAFNGAMVGFVKTRAFLTTLVTFLILRAVLNILVRKYSSLVDSGTNDSAAWDYIGGGSLLGVPFNVFVLIAVALLGHVILSRSRPGWHLYAIGGGRRAARNAGIPVERMLFAAYVVSGLLSAGAGVLFAARLNNASTDTGAGMEIQVLTVVVLGGVSLGGGKGSVGRALIGSTIVLVLINSLVRLGLGGGYASIAVGSILLLAVGIDVKWLKNKSKAIAKIYVVPTYLRLPDAPDIRAGCGTPYEENCRLSDATPIGLGEVDGPEDIIVDRQGRLYGAVREGWIVRFEPGQTTNPEIFAVTGGRPLGMAFDKDDNLIVCVAGMGLYGARPNGEVFRLTDETNRTPWKLKDDSRLVLADDLDIGPDGKIYFSEATIRYEVEDWPYDAIEGRGNGRMILLRPRDQEDPDNREGHLVSQWSLRRARRAVDLLRHDVALQADALLDRRTQERQAANAHREAAGVSRQHQPRLRRHVLALDRRHAHACFRPGASQAGLSDAHGQAPAAR